MGRQQGGVVAIQPAKVRSSIFQRLDAGPAGVRNASHIESDVPGSDGQQGVRSGSQGSRGMRLGRLPEAGLRDVGRAGAPDRPVGDPPSALRPLDQNRASVHQLGHAGDQAESGLKGPRPLHVPALAQDLHPPLLRVGAREVGGQALAATWGRLSSTAMASGER